MTLGEKKNGKENFLKSERIYVRLSLAVLIHIIIFVTSNVKIVYWIIEEKTKKKFPKKIEEIMKNVPVF